MKNYQSVIVGLSIGVISSIVAKKLGYLYLSLNWWICTSVFNITTISLLVLIFYLISKHNKK